MKIVVALVALFLAEPAIAAKKRKKRKKSRSEPVTLPIRGEISVQAADQTSLPMKKVERTASLDLILDWQSILGTIYGEGTLRHNAVQEEKESEKKKNDRDESTTLRELYWKKSLGPLSVTAGRNITVWSKADLLPVADVVSPVDQTNALFAKPSHVRLGQDLGKLDIYVGPIQATILASAAPQMNRLPALKLEDTIILDAPETGARLALETSIFTLSAFAGRFHDRDGILLFDAETTELTKTHFRSDMAGGTATLAAGPMLFKAEGLFTKQKPYQLVHEDGTLAVIHIDTRSGTTGVDWDLGPAGTFTAELSARVPAFDVASLIEPEHTWGVLWMKTLLEDRLTLSAAFFTFMYAGDELARGGFEYRLTDAWKLGAQYTQIRQASERPEMQAIEHLDRAEISLAYGFDLSTGR